jgi:hypothetical protein
MEAAPALAKAATDHQLLLAHGSELAAVTSPQDPWDPKAACRFMNETGGPCRNRFTERRTGRHQ